MLVKSHLKFQVKVSLGTPEHFRTELNECLSVEQIQCSN